MHSTNLEYKELKMTMFEDVESKGPYVVMFFCFGNHRWVESETCPACGREFSFAVTARYDSEFHPVVARLWRDFALVRPEETQQTSL
jgi:hypothetical protein